MVRPETKLIELRTVMDVDTKSAICDEVLHALPQWFGIERAVRDYIQAVRNQDFVAVYDGPTPIGFIAVKHHNPYTSEMYVLGIRPEYHRRGIGTRLVNHVLARCAGRGTKLLTVKTLSASHPDPGYAGTRRFYEAMDFLPVEEFPQLWGPANPCLLMARIVKWRG